MLLAAGAACGGSEGGVGGDRKAYIDALTPACQDAIQEADRLGDGTDVTTLEQVAAVWDALYQDVKGREIPSEDFDGGQKFSVGITNVSLAANDAYQRALINDNAGVQRALDTEEKAKISTSETAEDYGFEEGCNELSTADEDD